jgi:hypothetical protein
LVQLYVYLTAGCNLACRHCWIASTYQDPAKEASAPFLDLTLLESTIQQARPLGLSMI